MECRKPILRVRSLLFDTPVDTRCSAGPSVSESVVELHFGGQE